MNNFDNSLDTLLRTATEYLKAGQKQEARDVLQDALAIDRNNLTTWELLWRAAYNLEEEVFSLKRILAINPRHAAAKKRFAELQPMGVGTKRGDSQPLSRRTTQRPAVRAKNRQTTTLLLLLGFLVSIVCLSVAGFALLRGGYVPFAFSSNRTATAVAEKNASCQMLIEKAIQASGSYCGSTNSNTACYGNNTLSAELAPNVAQRFSERGDIIAVNELQRLSASPLNLSNNQWGIAVFKVIANLPRSLPGETVSMVVFGNATLDNRNAGSDSLESFYFSSELGQIVCEKVPFDGMMITSPDGSGVHFTVNGSELTLMGNASIKAIKNGKMEVTVYKGSARIVSNGQEQYFGAGQKTSVQLGGANGSESISVPSEPETLTGDELTTACTMTGQFCSPSDIVPVSEAQAQAQIQSAITSTPTAISTSTVTLTPSPTAPPTYTLVVLPSITPSKKPTLTPTVTKPPTRTPAPTQTITNTPTRTNTPTSTVVILPTNTPIPTATPPAPLVSACTSVSMSALTNPNNNELSTDITNSSGVIITINRFFAFWEKSQPSFKLDFLRLAGVDIWNRSDPDSPSDFPAESNWNSNPDLTIPDGVTKTLLIHFSNDLLPTGRYEVHIYFDINCQVSRP
ncbi:MAG: hypothetical protein ABI904_18050 [Chloroflexota bacterium]